MVAIKGSEFRRYVTAYPLFWIGFQDKNAVHIDVFFTYTWHLEKHFSNINVPSTVKLYPLSSYEFGLSNDIQN